MGKSIKITYKGETYTLGYTRAIIGYMEDEYGFDPTKLERMPQKQIPVLVRGAFMLNHGDVPVETVDEIYDSLVDKLPFIGKLSEMCAETYKSLFADPETNEGNAIWEATF